MSLTEQYLQLAQGQRPFQVKPVFVDPLRDVFSPIHAEFSDQLSQQNREMTAEIGRSGLLLWADRDLLKLVCAGLIACGVENSDPGSAVAFNFLEIGSYDAINVMVQCQSISQDMIDRAMNNGSSSHLAGQIRLDIAQEIISAHGGRLWAEVQQGNSVTFSIKLPKRDKSPIRRY